MNIDRILTKLNKHSVRYLLIGGVNFMLRHKYCGLSDQDMLACQTVLTEAEQKQDRVDTLRKAIGQ